MKKFFLISSLVSAMAISSVAGADEKPLNKFGLDVALGVPTGATLGAVISPTRWSRFELGGGYNGLAPGVGTSGTIDFINFPISPSFTADLGHYFNGSIPGVSKSPDISYTYVNLHLGVEIGKQNSVRFYVHSGLTYMNLNVSNVQKAIGVSDSSVYFGNPSFSGFVAPSAKMGLVYMF